MHWWLIAHQWQKLLCLLCLGAVAPPQAVVQLGPCRVPHRQLLAQHLTGNGMSGHPTGCQSPAESNIMYCCTVVQRYSAHIQEPIMSKCVRVCACARTHVPAHYSRLYAHAIILNSILTTEMNRCGPVCGCSACLRLLQKSATCADRQTEHSKEQGCIRDAESSPVRSPAKLFTFISSTSTSPFCAAACRAACLRCAASAALRAAAAVMWEGDVRVLWQRKRKYYFVCPRSGVYHQQDRRNH